MTVAKAKGRLRGKQPKLSLRQEAHLVSLWRTGTHTIAELSTVARSTVYRAIHCAEPAATGIAPYLPAQPTAHDASTRRPAHAMQPPRGHDLLGSVTWPGDYRPLCPRCQQPTTGLREKRAHLRSVRDPVVTATAVPCGCHVDAHAATPQAGIGTA